MSNEKPLVNKSFAEAFEKAKKEKETKEYHDARKTVMNEPDNGFIDFQGEIVEEK